MVQPCQIVTPWWPNHISWCGCVARSVVLLKPNAANILLFNFCEQKLIQHGPITPLTTTASPCSFSKKTGLIVLLNQKPHQTVTHFGCVGFSMHAFRFFVTQMRQFCLLTYPPRSKWASSEKQIFFFFFAKIDIFCKSICRNISQRCSRVYTTIFIWRKDKTNYMSNLTWVKCYHLWNKH